MVLSTLEENRKKSIYFLVHIQFGHIFSLQMGHILYASEIDPTQKVQYLRFGLLKVKDY